MKYRTFGRTQLKVSEIGYGMWGLAGWTGTDTRELDEALDIKKVAGRSVVNSLSAYLINGIQLTTVVNRKWTPSFVVPEK